MKKSEFLSAMKRYYDDRKEIAEFNCTDFNYNIFLAEFDVEYFISSYLAFEYDFKKSVLKTALCVSEKEFTDAF